MLSVVPGRASAIFNLEYPQSVVVVDDYATAQKIVDQLSDKEFPVENLCIVGTAVSYTHLTLPTTPYV